MIYLFWIVRKPIKINSLLYQQLGYFLSFLSSSLSSSGEILWPFFFFSYLTRLRISSSRFSSILRVRIWTTMSLMYLLDYSTPIILQILKEIKMMIFDINFMNRTNQAQPYWFIVVIKYISVYLMKFFEIFFSCYL